jgi:DNA-binding transcriptional MocR family regulator
MEALYIALRVLTRPGDNVLIQSPTYYCFLQLLETLGLRAVEIPSDPKHGINPADLTKALSTFEVAACILSGNFNNPDGALTPDAAKREIVDILAARGIPLVDDDVSADLHFDAQRPASFKQYDKKGLVVFCSSFSKTIAPGYRAGWMLPGRFMDKALEVKATTNVCCAHAGSRRRIHAAGAVRQTAEKIALRLSDTDMRHA